MSNVSDEFDDELLSAYVDGELTVSERALVEERLRTDAHAAQLVEELRALSRAIKSLPRETLGRDLRASIQAELDDSQAESHRHIVPLSEPLDPPRGFRRGFIWSTIAIAAALLLMFVQGDEAERDIAAVAKVEQQNRAGGRGRDSVSRRDEDLPNLGEMRALDEGTEAAKPAAAGGGSTAAAPTGGPAPESHFYADLAQKEESGASGNWDESAQAQRSLDRAGAPAQPRGSLAEGGAMDSDALSTAPATEQASTSQLAANAATSGPVPSAPPASTPTPAAGEPASSPAPALTTVELEVRAPNGVERFKHLLFVNNFQVQPAIEEAAEANDASALTRKSGSLGPSAEFEDRYAKQRGLADDESSIEVLVEGSPDQVQELLLRCAAEPQTFAQVNTPESLDRLRANYEQSAAEAETVAGAALAAGGEENAPVNAPADRDLALREESKAVNGQSGGVPTGGGFGGGGEDARLFDGRAPEQGQALDEAILTDKAKPPTGRAWYLPLNRRGGDAFAYGLGNEADVADKEDQTKWKAEAPLAQSGVQPGASVETPPATASASSATDSQFARRGMAAPAKAPNELPPAGQVRVRFVLRARTPADQQPAAAGEAKPAAPPDQ